MSLEVSIDSEPTMPGTAVFDLTVLKQLESELATVQVIVETFQAGTYGQCIACGVEIDRDLLRTDPLRTTCEPHDGLNAPLANSPDSTVVDE
jgi:RNA polymerase-binding transcription factor DksA